MNTASSPLQIHRYPILDSTNTRAKELAMDGAPHGTVVIADQQSAGRGRLGRRFFSPAGCGIYLSLLLRPGEMGLSQCDTVLITTAASVAVARAVSQTLHKELKIKWVNDLYFNGKKVCGILTEGVVNPRRMIDPRRAGNCSQRQAIDAIILGIGVNYRTPEGDFPTELQDIAGALLNAAEAAPPKDELAEAIAREMLSLLPQMESRDFLKEYRDRSMILGRRIRIFPGGASGNHPDISDHGFRVARALDIASNGGLVVQYEDGTVETLTTGEVSVRFADESAQTGGRM